MRILDLKPKKETKPPMQIPKKIYDIYAYVSVLGFLFF